MQRGTSDGVQIGGKFPRKLAAWIEKMGSPWLYTLRSRYLAGLVGEG
jgi:hypothetical protein